MRIDFSPVVKGRGGLLSTEFADEEKRSVRNKYRISKNCFLIKNSGIFQDLMTSYVLSDIHLYMHRVSKHILFRNSSEWCETKLEREDINKIIYVHLYVCLYVRTYTPVYVYRTYINTLTTYIAPTTGL